MLDLKVTQHPLADSDAAMLKISRRAILGKFCPSCQANGRKNQTPCQVLFLLSNSRCVVKTRWQRTRSLSGLGGATRGERGGGPRPIVPRSHRWVGIDAPVRAPSPRTRCCPPDPLWCPPSCAPPAAEQIRLKGVSRSLQEWAWVRVKSLPGTWSHCLDLLSEDEFNHRSLSKLSVSLPAIKLTG